MRVRIRVRMRVRMRVRAWVGSGSGFGLGFGSRLARVGVWMRVWVKVKVGFARLDYDCAWRGRSPISATGCKPRSNQPISSFVSLFFGLLVRGGYVAVGVRWGVRGGYVAVGGPQIPVFGRLCKGVPKLQCKGCGVKNKLHWSFAQI